MKVIKIYEQVKEYIEQDARQKSPGEYLSSEMQYAEQLDVSRPTVRKAVSELIEIGLIQRVPGKGLAVGNGIVSSGGKILIGMPFATGDGFIFRIVMSCIESANRLNYEYKVINSLDPEERMHLIMQESAEDYAAFILTIYDTSYDQQLIENLISRNARILLVDNKPDRLDLPIIGCNDFAGGYMVGKYLIKKNHRKIMYITSTRNVQTVRDRLDGFMQAFKDENLDTSEIFVYAVIDKGNPQMSNFFDTSFDCSILKEKGITALCGYSSLPIVSLCNTLALQGYRIPQDLRVIGYGEYSVVTATNTPITTIETHAEEMGRAIIESIEQAKKLKQPLKGRIIPATLDHRHTVLQLPK